MEILNNTKWSSNIDGAIISGLDYETAITPIQDALYATGKFTTDECSTLANGIFDYIKDAGLRIVMDR
jgi:hypothetical protein